MNNFSLYDFFIKMVYFLTPMYVANGFALLTGGGVPLDMNKTFFDGRRILGDGKTFRGTVLGVVFGFFSGFLLKEPIEGIILSIGAVFGDIVGSFIKRRLGIKRGEMAPLLDQLDFYLMGSFLYSLKFNLQLNVFLTGLVATPIAHLIGNLIAFITKAKDRPY